MLGLMQERPLMISDLIEFAAVNHPDEEIVSRTVEGPIHRYTYKECAARSRQLAKALDKLGVQQGDCMGTMAWNGYRHVEIYYGVSGLGAICHTINPRLFPEQIIYILNHAEDKITNGRRSTSGPHLHCVTRLAPQAILRVFPTPTAQPFCTAMPFVRLTVWDCPMLKRFCPWSPCFTSMPGASPMHRPCAGPRWLCRGRKWTVNPCTSSWKVKVLPFRRGCPPSG